VAHLLILSRTVIILLLLLGFDPMWDRMLASNSGSILLAAQVLDGLFLFISQVIFVSMDCIRIKAPRVRVMLGLNIMLALIDGVLSRAQYDFPLESFAVWPGSLGTVFSAVGQKPKQQFIQTFDFSVLSLLLAAVATTIKFPHKLAFIIIHTDQYGVAAEQASEVEHSRSKMQYRRVREVTDRQKTDGLRSSNDKLAKCVQTLHAKGLGRLATAITNKSGSLGRGVTNKGLSIYGKFKADHEEHDSD